MLPRESGHVPESSSAITRYHGEVCASFLRRQTLVKLAYDCGREFPVSKFARDPRTGNLVLGECSNQSLINIYLERIRHKTAGMA